MDNIDNLSPYSLISSDSDLITNVSVELTPIKTPPAPRPIPESPNPISESPKNTFIPPLSPIDILSPSTPLNNNNNKSCIDRLLQTCFSSKFSLYK